MELIGWKHLSGGCGDAGMRRERRLSGRNHSGRRKPLPSFLDSGAKAINPRGLGTESPSNRASTLRFGRAWPITEVVGILGLAISLQGADTSMIDQQHSTAAANLVAIDIAKDWNFALVQATSGRRQRFKLPIAAPITIISCSSFIRCPVR